MAEQEQRTNLIAVITRDHRNVEAVFAQLEDGAVSRDRRKDLVDHVIAELVRHSVAEEQFMYPATRKHLSDGHAIVRHELEEHGEAEQIMKELEGLDAGDPRFEQRLRRLMEVIRHHVSEEESNLLPRLAEALSPAQLDDLGQRVLRAKSVAPTRPHPTAPVSPPANRILGPGAGFIDRIRDALSGREV